MFFIEKLFLYILATPQKGHRRSLSSNNLLSISPTKSIPPDPTPPQECYVISNSTASDNVDGGYNTSNGSPTIHQEIPIGRSSSDGKDYVNSSMRTAALTHDSYPTKKKYKNRNKSWEFESSHLDPSTNDVGSDIDGTLFTPSTPVNKKKMHRRQKSNALPKDLVTLEGGRATDTGLF